MFKSLGKLGGAIAAGLLALAGCSTTQSNNHVDHPLTAIYSVVTAEMSMGIQRYSENHRIFYSRPFMVNHRQDPTKPKTKPRFRERGIAEVSILGDERPYTIEVEVRIERAELRPGVPENKLEYSHQRYDKGLANKLLTNIINHLDKNEAKQNVIDDFRPF